MQSKPSTQSCSEENCLPADRRRSAPSRVGNANSAGKGVARSCWEVSLGNSEFDLVPSGAI